MVILQILNSIISFICYILGGFQLVITIQSNIRDSMWELGVLRSMGMNKNDVLKVTVYESLANNMASVLCGFIIGLLVSIGSIG
jgi:ABC-type antimicrobial peptide transport system permease subunit